MKWLRTLLVISRGTTVQSAEWQNLHAAYVRAIESIDFPEKSGSLTIRKKHKDADGETKRNGVKYLKARFFKQMTDVEAWTAEAQATIEKLQDEVHVVTYPDLAPHTEQVESMFGGFDFLTKTDSGFTAAIEWETGNISSSHRSLNKLTIALSAGVIDAGVLILPSRELYEHLTDRVGNMMEISPYLGLWHKTGSSMKSGILAITVVEHDELTDEPTHQLLPTGNDGRAAEGRRNAQARATRRKKANPQTKPRREAGTS